MKQLAPQHPEWKMTQPFKALLEGDMKTVPASGEKGILEMGMARRSSGRDRWYWPCPVMHATRGYKLPAIEAR